jgi:hypothetical protein
MAGRRMRVNYTEAVIRKQAVEWLRAVPRNDRRNQAFRYMEHMACSEDFFYTTAQMRGAATGLREVLKDGNP